MGSLLGYPAEGDIQLSIIISVFLLLIFAFSNPPLCICPWLEKPGSRDKWMLSKRSEQWLFTLGTEKHPLNRKHVFLPRLRITEQTHTHGFTDSSRQPGVTLTSATAEHQIPERGGRRQSPTTTCVLRAQDRDTQQPRDSRHLM